MEKIYFEMFILFCLRGVVLISRCTQCLNLFIIFIRYLPRKSYLIYIKNQFNVFLLIATKICAYFTHMIISMIGTKTCGFRERQRGQLKSHVSEATLTAFFK